MLTWVACQVSAALVCVQARMAVGFVKWLHETQALWRLQIPIQKDYDDHDHNNDDDGFYYYFYYFFFIIMKLVIRDTS